MKTSKKEKKREKSEKPKKLKQENNKRKRKEEKTKTKDKAGEKCKSLLDKGCCCWEMLNTSANVLCDRRILGEEMDCCLCLHL